MGKIIAFANQKGGVGKTTTCVNVATYMALMDKKVLIVVNDFTTVYNFRIELVEYLVKIGEEVYIALPSDERNHLLEEKGAKVIDLKINRFGTNPIEDFKTTLSIRKIINGKYFKYKYWGLEINLDAKNVTYIWE